MKTTKEERYKLRDDWIDSGDGRMHDTRTGLMEPYRNKHLNAALADIEELEGKLEMAKFAL